MESLPKIVYFCFYILHVSQLLGSSFLNAVFFVRDFMYLLNEQVVREEHVLGHTCYGLNN